MSIQIRVSLLSWKHLSHYLQSLSHSLVPNIRSPISKQLKGQLGPRVSDKKGKENDHPFKLCQEGQLGRSCNEKLSLPYIKGRCLFVCLSQKISLPCITGRCLFVCLSRKLALPYIIGRYLFVCLGVTKNEL